MYIHIRFYQQFSNKFFELMQIFSRNVMIPPIGDHHRIQQHHHHHNRRYAVNVTFTPIQWYLKQLMK